MHCACSFIGRWQNIQSILLHDLFRQKKNQSQLTLVTYTYIYINAIGHVFKGNRRLQHQHNDPLCYICITDFVSVVEKRSCKNRVKHLSCHCDAAFFYKTRKHFNVTMEKRVLRQGNK